MKRLIILAFLISILLPVGVAFAYSDLARDFLIAARRTEAVFPPEDWSDTDLRSAALEVLDNFEATGSDDWALYFCLLALGHTRNEDDIPRILKYEDKMTGCVLHALSGFPAPDAIECLDRWIRARRPHLRQTAIEGLAQVDYNQMDEPSAWRDWILGELRSVRETETVQEIIDLIDQSIAAIESSAETSGD